MNFVYKQKRELKVYRANGICAGVSHCYYPAAVISYMLFLFQTSLSRDRLVHVLRLFMSLPISFYMSDIMDFIFFNFNYFNHIVTLINHNKINCTRNLQRAYEYLCLYDC